MKELNAESMNSLPFHDSDYIGSQITQQDDGITDLRLDIAFCEGEYEDLHDFPEINKSNGNATLLLADCAWIRINSICNTTNRDSIDYIRISSDLPELRGVSLAP